MMSIDLLIKFMCVLGILAIFWWLLSQFNLPQPIRILVCVVMAIFGILFLADVGGLNSGHPLLR